jgi:hypothetical protein
MKERRHSQARRMEVGDRMVPYLTRVMRIAFQWRLRTAFGDAAPPMDRMHAASGAPL